MGAVTKGFSESRSGMLYSIMVCTKDDYDAFCREEVVWNPNTCEFIDSKLLDDNLLDDGCIPYGAWCELYENCIFQIDYTTPSGDQIVVFGDVDKWPI